MTRTNLRKIYHGEDGTIHIDKVETHLINDLEFFPGHCIIYAKSHIIRIWYYCYNESEWNWEGHYDIMKSLIFIWCKSWKSMALTY